MINWYLHVLKHKTKVAIEGFRFIGVLLCRLLTHDMSKFSKDEAILYAKALPKFKDIPYGTPEYFSLLRELVPSIQHHYQHNSHHPEHYSEGIDGMSLMDIVEMWLDWKAASTDFRKSVYFNQKRFKISTQLTKVFTN